jgi:parallel beta-helix repeat protein
MDASKIRGISRFVILLALSFPPPVAAAHVAVDCDRPRASDERDRPGALQRAINTSRPGDTILVRGTCNENVTIPVGKDLITLDGSGTAAITGPDPTQPTVLVRGRDITIRGFTITGGRDGIAVVIQGGARVDGNTIHNTGRYGIYVSRLSFAVIVNNTIQDNIQAGIAVGAFAMAFIGFETGLETVASPNLITGNGAQGIVVGGGNAHAYIVGNDISHNRANGVNVREASDAHISDNIVNGNGQNGILVAQGSGVFLGTDTGDTIFTRPNKTTTNNLGFGIRCRVGGFTDGRLGSLNGDSGPEDYLEGCVPSLIR